MTYPAEGLGMNVREHSEDCSAHLSRAQGMCNFDIPDDCPERPFLLGLANKLSQYRTENENIRTKIHYLDKNYNELSRDLEISVSRLSVAKMELRERLVTG